jgi:hypothetical protein
MAARIAGKRMHLWRAVDDVGEMLDVLVQRRRNRAATDKLLEKRGLGFRCNDCREFRRAAADNKPAHLPRSTSSTSSSGRPPPVPPARVPGLRALLAVVVGVVAVATLHFVGEVRITSGSDRAPLHSAFQQPFQRRATPRGRAPLRC